MLVVLCKGKRWQTYRWTVSPRMNNKLHEEIKRGGSAPHSSHHHSHISPLYCNQQALLLVVEWLCFPSGTLEAQILQEWEHSGPKGPAVSMATGAMVWHWLRAEYFPSLLRTARAATAPALLVAHGRWLGAKVLGQVPFHTKGSATSPGHQCDAIRAFSVWAEKPSWF